MKEELNRVHLKYVNQQQILEKRNFMISKKLQFMNQIYNLKQNGEKLDKM